MVGMDMYVIRTKQNFTLNIMMLASIVSVVNIT
jgi:hypothetical protein